MRLIISFPLILFIEGGYEIFFESLEKVITRLYQFFCKIISTFLRFSSIHQRPLLANRPRALSLERLERGINWNLVREGNRSIPPSFFFSSFSFPHPPSSRSEFKLPWKVNEANSPRDRIRSFGN